MPFLSSDSLEERLARVPTTDTLPAGMWDNFWSGAGKHAMRSFATVGRAIDLAGAVGPMVVDYFRGGTELQDQYFQEHDELFNSAVDYWTPKPNEVGMAGQVVGSLVGMLPVVIASPHLAVGATVLTGAEDLTRQGVSPARAVGVGVAQGVGLGVGIWMPTIGTNLLERALVGGAGANALQGIATREASSLILSGTPQAKQFEAFDPEQLTTDVLLGLAFGVWAHVDKGQRVQGKEAWDKVAAWAQSWKPSQKDALMALRQAQHINADSMPGKPQDLGDIERHVAKIRQSIDQLARDKPVVVEDMPAAHVNPDPERQAAAEKHLQDMAGIAEDVAKSEGIRAEPTLGELPDETGGRAEPQLITEEPQPVKPKAEAKAKPAESLDPLTAESQRLAQQYPDLKIPLGDDVEPVSVRDYLKQADDMVAQAEADVGLFETAARCLLGA